MHGIEGDDIYGAGIKGGYGYDDKCYDPYNDGVMIALLMSVNIGDESSGLSSHATTQAVQLLEILAYAKCTDHYFSFAFDIS
jgi:hypothetical protein